MDVIPQFSDRSGVQSRVLPSGRYCATLTEVRNRYVPEGDSGREKIWSAFLSVVQTLQQHCGPVAFAWIGGSFVTDKAAPQDIDVVFGLESSLVERIQEGSDSDAKLLLDILCKRVPKLPAHLQKIDPLVDAFLLSVKPTGVGIRSEQLDYLIWRGYWDQLWSKVKLCDDTECPYPVCGYIEVTIDGFSK